MDNPTTQPRPSRRCLAILRRRGDLWCLCGGYRGARGSGLREQPSSYRVFRTAAIVLLISKPRLSVLFWGHFSVTVPRPKVENLGQEDIESVQVGNDKESRLLRLPRTNL